MPGLVRRECEELQKRLRARLADGSITAHPIDIEDLQDVEVLRNRKRLSIGELSVIVFARKTAQAILTDDKGAQNLAKAALAANTVQSTPHLFAWLYFNSLLSGSGKEQVAADMLLLNRNLKPHLENYHTEAQRSRAIATQAAHLGSWKAEIIQPCMTLRFIAYRDLKHPVGHSLRHYDSRVRVMDEGQKLNRKEHYGFRCLCLLRLR